MKLKRLTLLALILTLILVLTALVACTPPAKHTVFFETDGGTELETQEVEAGKTATIPTPPEKEGFIFDGWYSDVAKTTLFDFTKAINADVVVFAKWNSIATEYTITYQPNGGSAVAAAVVPVGENTEAPTDPERSGKVFEGWYTDAACTTKFTFGGKLISNITLYAKWGDPVIEPTKFTVTFSAGTGATAIAPQSILEDALATRPTNPTRLGYTFDNWYVSTASSAAAYDFSQPVTANITLYARWTVGYYTVNFESLALRQEHSYSLGNIYVAGSESFASGDRIAYDTRICFAASPYNVPAADRVVAMFLNGVSISKALCTDPTLQTKLGLTSNDYYYYFTVTGNCEITGLATFFVTFNANGGNWKVPGGTVTTRTEYILNGSTVLPTPPERQGYTFIGWYNAQGGTQEISWGGEFNKDNAGTTKTVYARWQVNKYNVSAGCDINGVTVELQAGSGGSVEFGGYVGLAINDKRTGTGLLPLLVRVNGVALENGVMDTSGVGATSKVFTIQVTGEMVITVTAERRVNINLQMVLNTNVTALYTAEQALVKLTLNSPITGTLVSQNFANFTAGRKIEFYALIKAGYLPAVAAAYAETVTIEPAIYLNDIPGTDIKEGDIIPNLYKVTYSPKLPLTESLTVSTAAVTATELKTFTISGTNVHDSKFIFGEYSSNVGGIIELIAAGDIKTTYTVTSAYAIKLVLVVLDDNINYRVYRKGFPLPIIDTANATSNVYIIDGVRYKAYIANSIVTSNSEQFPADEEFEIRHYYVASVYENDIIKDFVSLLPGEPWTMVMAKSAQKSVYVDGVRLVGVEINETQIRYTAEIDAKTRIDIYDLSPIVVVTPTVTDDRRATTNAPTAIEYDAILRFRVTPGGTGGAYTGYIYYVTVNGRLMFPNANGEYEFDTRLVSAGYQITIRVEFTNSFVYLSFDGESKSFNVPAPANATLLSNLTLPPLPQGKAFKQWNIHEYNVTKGEWAGTDFHSPAPTYERTLNAISSPEIGPNYWIAAIYEDIKPAVTIVNNLVTSIYDIGTVTVDGKAAIPAGQGGTALEYKQALVQGSVNVGFSDIIVINVDRKTGATDMLNYTLKVFVGTREIQPTSEGVYTIRVADYAEYYKTANSPLVITLSYRQTHTTTADGAGIAKILLSSAPSGDIWAAEYTKYDSLLSATNATNIYFNIDAQVFYTRNNKVADFYFVLGQYSSTSIYYEDNQRISNPETRFAGTMFGVKLTDITTNPGPTDMAVAKMKVITVETSSGAKTNYVFYVSFTIPAPVAPPAP